MEKQYKSWHRALASLCVWALLVTLLPIPAAAAAGPVLRVSSSSAYQGSTCTVTVSIDRPEALRIAEIFLSYDDSVLTLESYNAYNYNSTDYMENISVNDKTPGQIKISAVNSHGLTREQVNIVSLVFRASENAACTSYPLTPGLGAVMTGTETELNQITMDKEGGTITVLPRRIQEASFYSSVEPGIVEAGSEALLTVGAHSLSGMAMGQFSLTYDEQLFAYQGLELLPNMKKKGHQVSVNTQNPGLVMVSWTAEEAAQTGDLFQLRLKALEGAEGSCSLSCVPSSLHDTGKQSIQAEAVGTQVQVVPKTAVDDLPNLWLEGPQTLQTNGSADFQLKAEGRSGLAAGDFFVDYDPQVLQVKLLETTAQPGVQLETQDYPGSGCIKINMICNGGIRSDLTLVSFRVTAKNNAAASTKLDLRTLKLADNGLQPVEMERIPAELAVQVPTFQVVFLDEAGNSLSEQQVPYLSGATAPAEPLQKAPDGEKHYTHTGWDQDFSSVTADLTLRPVFEAAAHSWNAGEITTKPTCTETGVKTFTCTVCGETKTETVEALGHNFSTEWTVDVEPTCTKPGSKSHHCIRCDAKSDVIEVPATGHSWDEGKITKDPTCTETGIKTFTCTVCGETKTETVEALGHNFSTEWTVDVEPTCTKPGSKSHHCTRCDAKSDATEIPATGHSWDAGKITKEPTCLEAGTKIFTCTVCHTARTEIVEALGHDLKGHERVEPKCLAVGSEAYWSCSRCGKLYADADAKTELQKPKEIAALGHDFTGKYLTDETGHWHKCSRCEVTDNKVSHSYEAHHCNETAKCTVCGYEKAPGEHAWGEAVVERQPTCTEVGSKTYTCTICGATKTEIVEALGHNYSSEWTVDVEPTCTKPGSKSHHCTRCDAKSDVTEISATNIHNWHNGICQDCGRKLAEVCLAEKKWTITSEFLKEQSIVMLASYSADGRMLSCRFTEWNGTKPLVLEASDAAEERLFLLDKTYRPQMEAVSSKDLLKP